MFIYIYILYIYKNIYIQTLEGVSPAQRTWTCQEMYGARIKRRPPQPVGALPPLCALGWGMLPLGVSVGQYSPDCDSMQFAMIPMTSIAASSRLKEGVEKSSKHCETNYDRIVVVLTFRMMSTFFNFLSAGLLHKPFGFYRGHLKLASTVAGMPVMERASLMRLMHRLLHWGVPEETRLTWCVAQFRKESIIED